MKTRFRDKYPATTLSQGVVTGQIDKERIKGAQNLPAKIITAVVLFVRSCSATDLFGLSAQMAFILLFALLPTLLFVILICSQVIVDFTPLFLAALSRILPVEGYNYISTEINLILGYVSRFRFFIIGSSAVMGTVSARTIITSLNQTYGFNPYRHRRWEWLKSFAVLLVLCLIVIVMAGLLIFCLYAFRNFLTTGTFEVPGTFLKESVVVAGTMASVFLMIWALYTFAPERRIHFSESWPGALFCIAGIFVVFEIYVQFLNRSANYLTLYGSLSGVFILLTALYFLSVIINIGAKINVFFSRR